MPRLWSPRLVIVGDTKVPSDSTPSLIEECFVDSGSYTSGINRTYLKRETKVRFITLLSERRRAFGFTSVNNQGVVELDQVRR
jgi:hypothetical protein